MECLKDKIIMYRANEVAYGVICWLKRSKICDFLIIFQALEPRYDPISDARRHMNDYFNFGAVIVYVLMRHLIQGMGDMALMPKLCEK